jgi:hypothetical protein
MGSGSVRSGHAEAPQRANGASEVGKRSVLNGRREQSQRSFGEKSTRLCSRVNATSTRLYHSPARRLPPPGDLPHPATSPTRRCAPPSPASRGRGRGVGERQPTTHPWPGCAEKPTGMRSVLNGQRERPKWACRGSAVGIGRLRSGQMERLKWANGACSTGGGSGGNVALRKSQRGFAEKPTWVCGKANVGLGKSQRGFEAESTRLRCHQVKAVRVFHKSTTTPWIGRFRAISPLN